MGNHPTEHEILLLAELERGGNLDRWKAMTTARYWAIQLHVLGVGGFAGCSHCQAILAKYRNQNPKKS
jgi:hypothetical protein